MLMTHDRYERSRGKYETLLLNFMRTLPEATLKDESPPMLRVQLEEKLAQAVSAFEQGRPWMVAFFLRAALQLDVSAPARGELEFLLFEFDPTVRVVSCGVV